MMTAPGSSRFCGRYVPTGAAGLAEAGFLVTVGSTASDVLVGRAVAAAVEDGVLVAGGAGVVAGALETVCVGFEVAALDGDGSKPPRERMTIAATSPPTATIATATNHIARRRLPPSASKS
jgi:hypothetical protein